MVNVEFKLFASLMVYLPADAKKHSVSVKLPKKTTIFELMDKFKVPHEQAHLVVRNGEFVPPSQRNTYQLQDGDVIALWPPVAGG
ncbi:MAG: MoaD/ThiS family protein [Candidatus Thiodiazotropha sp. (ex Monitilora ramsayi)]|nr:MoaD/ThiS family protein [Candidatus Thiodiazotropha sp. (ex Monitilora ramsayi)]